MKKDYALRELDRVLAERKALCTKVEGRGYTNEEKELDDQLTEQSDRLEQKLRFIAKYGERDEGAVDYAMTPAGVASRASGIVFETSDGKQVRGFRSNESIREAIPHYRSEMSELSVGRCVQSWITGDWSKAKAERDALGSSSGSLGGFLLNPELSANVIDLARAQSVCMRAGALTIPVSTSELGIVRVASDPTPHWRGENTAIIESNPTFDMVMLRPKTCGILIRVPEELLADAANAASSIESVMANRIAQEIDRVMLFGNGTQEPLGVSNWSDINELEIAENGGVPSSYDDLSKAVQAIGMSNFAGNALVWSPRSQGTYDRLKDQQDQPLQMPPSVAALQRFATTQMPIDEEHGTGQDCSSIIVGQWNQLVLGLRLGLQLEASRHADDAFARYQTLIRAIIRIDTAVLRAGAFAAVRGIKA